MTIDSPFSSLPNAVCIKMAKDAIASGSPANNPKVPTEEEIIELYNYFYSYQ